MTPPSFALSSVSLACFSSRATRRCSTRVPTGLTSTIFQTRHAFNHERRAGGARWLGKFGQAMLFVPIIFSKFPINSVFMLIRSPSRAVTTVALPRTSSRNSCERAGVNRVSTMPVDPLFNWILFRPRNDDRGILTSNGSRTDPPDGLLAIRGDTIDVIYTVVQKSWNKYYACTTKIINCTCTSTIFTT